MIKIAIADDHDLVREGLESLLKDTEDINPVILAKNGRELLDLMNERSVHVVLLDIDMPELNGVETTRELKRIFPDVRILILTMHDEKHFIQQLIGEGAHGYLLKNSSRDELTTAIRLVYSGKNSFSGEVTMKLAASVDSEVSTELSELTSREMEILTQIAKGKSNKEIGEELFISHRTVDTHRTNLMKKLDVNNIAGLIRIAYRNKLIE